MHGPFNTGLPDYFRLVILEEPSAEALRWGRPYIDAWVVDRIPLEELEGEEVDTNRESEDWPTKI